VIETLYKFSRGRPRLLNTLADNALFEAYLAGRAAIDSGDVERAAADLCIGADPGSTFSHSSSAAPVPELPTTEVTPSAAPTERETPIREAFAESELMPDVAPVADSPIATIDLDEGLDAALEDFGNAAAAAGSSASDLSIESDTLQFETEPTAPVAEMILDEPLSPEFVSQPELVLAEAELAPLSAGEADQFDDVIVELIEE